MNDIWETRIRKEKVQKRKEKIKRKHHAYALIVLILAAAIIILGTVLLFYIQEVEVSGNEYCDSQEIVECVQNDKLSKNSLYVLAKYSLGKKETGVSGYIESQYEKSMDTKNYRKRKDNGRLCEIGEKIQLF